MKIRLFLVILSMLTISACLVHPVPPSPTVPPTYTPQPTYTALPTFTPQPTFTNQPTHAAPPTYTAQPTATVSITSTPSPTLVLLASLTPEPITVTNILLKEDFETEDFCFKEEVIGVNSDSIFSGGLRTDGNYLLSLNGKAGEIYFSPCRELLLSSFEIAVDIKVDEIPEGAGYGIVFQPFFPPFSLQESTYAFLINGKGEYCILEHNKGFQQTIAVNRLAGCWVKAPTTINPEQFNTIRVVIDPSGYKLFVNEVNCATVTRGALQNRGSDGLVGLAVGLAENGGKVRIRFDNVVIKDQH